ncbi:uncharacterized protein [Nicotiana sylvestris]|uniref:uncharacterized protein n=1 Tax=Nicotiana sylvestris TaxID=4096 RepID=UPI00388C6BE6
MVVTNEKNELIPTRTVTGWRVHMDYHKPNKVIRKDHFPLPLQDQMLDRLAGRAFYCFLDGYSGYNQILILQRIKKQLFLHVLMVPSHSRGRHLGCAMHRNSFDNYLETWIKYWQDVTKQTWCSIGRNVISWLRNIVLGHKISKNGIEVDKAKIEMISKLQPPTSVKDGVLEEEQREIIRACHSSPYGGHMAEQERRPKC